MSPSKSKSTKLSSDFGFLFVNGVSKLLESKLCLNLASAKSVCLTCKYYWNFRMPQNQALPIGFRWLEFEIIITKAAAFSRLAGENLAQLSAF